MNPDEHGTKASWWYQLAVPAGGQAEVRLEHRGDQEASTADNAWHGSYFDTVMADRGRRLTSSTRPWLRMILARTDAGAAPILRGPDLEQTDVPVPGGLAGRGSRSATSTGRASVWPEFWLAPRPVHFDVLAMPDPWEYPWFAAWDLAFHAITWAYLDPAFAKYQLLVLLREWFLHPNGALPAYEWSFDDVNPQSMPRRLGPVRH